MDIVGSGIVEFLIFLRVGKIVISAQNFILDITTDDRTIFPDKPFPELSDELMGLEANALGIREILPFVLFSCPYGLPLFHKDINPFRGIFQSGQSYHPFM